MNHADIETARRLIAQFEGNALGRHNSGQFRENPLAEGAGLRLVPEQRWHISGIKSGPEECHVGDYCWSMGRPVREDNPTVRFLPPPDPKRFIDFNDAPSIDDAMVAWEFERIYIVTHLPGIARHEAWHRIA